MPSYETDFYVDEDYILQPLGVHVLRDSRVDLMPRIRDITDEVPGKHGDIYFGSKLEPRLLELHVVTDDGLLVEEREELKRGIAAHLNPLGGEKTLSFADDSGKMYYVRCAGNVDTQLTLTWFEFTINFKTSRPYMVSVEEHELGEAGYIENIGNYPTPIAIELVGPVENPVITIGEDELKYTGILTDLDTLVIDTEHKTVTRNGFNALDDFEGDFPCIEPGETPFSVSGGAVTVKWRDRWI